MSPNGSGARWALAIICLLAFAVLPAAAAAAETPTTICIPTKAGKALVSGENGTCKENGYNAVDLPGSGGLEVLNKVLPHMSYIEKGVGGKPTVRFSAVNVQLVDGEGKTICPPGVELGSVVCNGEGNLVIGYDETAPEPGCEKRPQHCDVQFGSHNLILGTLQSFSSYGGIVAGTDNQILAPFASVTGGVNNLATGEEATAVSGGEANIAGGRVASVSGGWENHAGGGGEPYASVSGGVENRAEGFGAWVGSGIANVASGNLASVSGGFFNLAEGGFASVSGGGGNTASGLTASVSGGVGSTASGGDASVSGGALNTASGEGASISGGQNNTASGGTASMSGGDFNQARGFDSWVGGGKFNKVLSEGEYASIFGGKEEKTSTPFDAIP